MKRSLKVLLATAIMGSSFGLTGCESIPEAQAEPSSSSSNKELSQADAAKKSQEVIDGSIGKVS